MRSKEQIKKNMLAVKTSGSNIEVSLGKALWAEGIRYRKQYKKLPGKPDFVIIKYKIAIFCDSHFWHGYKWKVRKYDHKTNINFWIKKIERNIQRDKEVNAKLIKKGWKVIRFWEHEIKTSVDKCVNKVIEIITIK